MEQVALFYIVFVPLYYSAIVSMSRFVRHQASVAEANADAAEDAKLEEEAQPGLGPKTGLEVEEIRIST